MSSENKIEKTHSKKSRIVLEWNEVKENILKRLYKKETVQNLKWYVWLSLLLAIIGLLVSVYTLLIPVQNIKNGVENLQYDYYSVFNPQNVDTSKMKGSDIIQLYYDSINTSAYEVACGLISIRHCNMSDSDHFTQWVKDKERKRKIEYKDGRSIVGDIINTNISYDNTNQELWCVRDTFQINGESEPITQIWQYRVITRPDGTKHIGSTLCESSEKRGTDRSQAMNCNSAEKLCSDFM